MRDLLKEFDNNIQVVREWFNDDSGNINESFVITRNGVDYRSFRSMPRAMDRALSLASRRTRNAS